MRTATLAAIVAAVLGGPVAAQEPELQPYRLPGPGAANQRWQLTAGAGLAAQGAPSYLVGAGVAFATFAGGRLDFTAQLGWSSRVRDVPVQPGWNVDGDTYLSAGTSPRAFLVELTGAWRAGPVELWAGGGAAVSFPQFKATYQYTACTDLLCLGPTYTATDTDWKIGSGATKPLVSMGARLPLFDHVLVGLDVRWLAHGASRVGDRYGVEIATGGVTATTSLVVRMGQPVQR